MDNLWKKESSAAGALYVDLFASHRTDKETEELIDKFAKANEIKRHKDMQLSMKYRHQGNDFFRMKNWSEAMSWYNKSLCFAEVQSENVSIMYLNRSWCFFHLQMYDEALNDLQLAKEANLPERLMPKLNQRKRKCQKLMATVEKPLRRELKLSYEPNKNYPCLADVVEIKYTPECGQHLVAKEDIPVGQIVLVEKDFLGTRTNGELLCRTCFQKNKNFIACTQCPDAVFCDNDCMTRNVLHKWECGSSQVNLSVNYRFYIQAVCVAIESFPNIESLMEFVENALREDPETIPTSIHDLKSGYHFFIKLKTNGNIKNSCFDLSFDYHKCVTNIPEIMALFDSEEKKRFLMHLMTFHCMISHTNSIQDHRSKSINNIFSLINHSCCPNLNSSCIADQNICESIRFVQKGQPLCISYLDTVLCNFPKELRQRQLKSIWNFDCKCEKCELTGNMSNFQLTFDPRYRFVYANLHDKHKYSAILEKCRQFLNEHGRLPWTKEIGYMIDKFAFMTQELYIKPLQ